jgi:hypothetical protein
MTRLLRHRRVRFVGLIIAGAVMLTSFQNCGGEFKSVGVDGENSSASKGPDGQPTATPTTTPTATPTVTPSPTPSVEPTTTPTMTPSPTPTEIPKPPPTSFGTWINVTPSNANPSGNFDCGNYGAETVQTDPAHPSHLYAQFHCQGIWKSTDYGATWTGPINTGTNGAMAGNCAGGITIPPHSAGSAPIIYEACIRGSIGFWKSVDGGVNWTQYFVAPMPASRQDFYPPVVDPYDENHLIMAAHEQNYIVESIDGGKNWSNIPMTNGMLQNGGTGELFFINTGSAATTKHTWLWLAQTSGGNIGTWRTENNGMIWTKVDNNEHPHGCSQIYQPDNNGVVYMAGAYSKSGWGVIRSTDYGKTWNHVGGGGNEALVFGTSKNVYAMYGWSTGDPVSPGFEIASQPGLGTWAQQSAPTFLGGPHEVGVVNDGSHNIFVGAMGKSGLWRYVEP